MWQVSSNPWMKSRHHQRRHPGIWGKNIGQVGYWIEASISFSQGKSQVLSSNWAVVFERYNSSQTIFTIHHCSDVWLDAPDNPLEVLCRLGSSAQSLTLVSVDLYLIIRCGISNSKSRGVGDTKTRSAQCPPRSSEKNWKFLRSVEILRVTRDSNELRPCNDGQFGTFQVEVSCLVYCRMHLRRWRLWYGYVMYNIL